MSKWWFWNQIPVTLGNIVSGVLLTAAPLFASYYSKPAVVVEEETIIENPQEVPAAL